MISLEETRKIIIDIAKENDIPIFEFLTFVISRDDGMPCIQIEGNTYYYLARNRSTIKFESELKKLLNLCIGYFAILHLKWQKGTN